MNSKEFDKDETKDSAELGRNDVQGESGGIPSDADHLDPERDNKPTDADRLDPEHGNIPIDADRLDPEHGNDPTDADRLGSEYGNNHTDEDRLHQEHDSILMDGDRSNYRDYDSIATDTDRTNHKEHENIPLEGGITRYTEPEKSTPQADYANAVHDEIGKPTGENHLFAGQYAGFWTRFWAYLLDLIVIGSINRLIINPVFRALDIPLLEEGIFSPMTIATAVVFYLYFVLMTKYLGQTLGKMVFGLKVVELDGTSLTWGTVIFREWIGRFISATIFVLYVVVAFTNKKQGLHDLFADTTVIYEPR
jgi:uncharacterized RDD family membrane protein YckC